MLNTEIKKSKSESIALDKTAIEPLIIQTNNFIQTSKKAVPEDTNVAILCNDSFFIVRIISNKYLVLKYVLFKIENFDI
ncbi:MAG: hypothetical protein LBU14_02525 [Candidatus Peribacteria bacterium]|nr:hypothetical protein [Candidatus Peribacteria bacterium]